MTAPLTGASTRVLVGGVGQLYQGDLDLGRRAADALAAEDLGSAVHVEELHYGAVAVAQLLQDLAPPTLVLVGAAARGDAPGTVRRGPVTPPRADPAAIQPAIGEAITGYVAIELVVEVAAALDALPPRTVAVEVEPAVTGPGEALSHDAAGGLARALGLVRDEVARAAG